MKPDYRRPSVSYSAFRDRNHFMNWVRAFHGRDVGTALELRLDAAAARADAVDPADELSKLMEEANERARIAADREI